MDEREFELLNILGKELGSNQRDFSQKMDLSLGMVNMIIRRLITKGYIRIEQLNKRKVQYILTPRGFAEKMQKSVKYTLNTINSIGLIRNNVKEIFIRFYNNGHKRFYIYGEPDLTILIEKAFTEADLKDADFKILDNLPDCELDGVLMIGKENVNADGFNKDRTVNLLTEIAQNNNFINK